MQSNPSPLFQRSNLRAQRAVLGATAALAFTCAAVSLAPQAARSQEHMKKPATALATVAQPAQISSCTGCHGDNLLGRKGFSPNLSKLGVLKEYNQKTFERVMNTGVTNDGGHVQKPMPVFHYPAAVSDKIYKYLLSIKTS